MRLRALREIACPELRRGVVTAAVGAVVFVAPAAQPAPPRIQFTDVTAAAGVRFKHESGAFGK